MNSNASSERAVRNSCALTFCILMMLVSTGHSGVAQDREALVFPLRLHVARRAGQSTAPIVHDAWLREQVATANILFAPHGVEFWAEERLRLSDRHAELETRADRHALGALLDHARIDVFIVRSLRDVDDPTLMRRGVHWRPVGRPGAHFVVVSSIAGSTVLAHELGHYFGNPHSPTAGNIMSYERGDGPPFFDSAQGRRIRRFARNFAQMRSPMPSSRSARDELPAEITLP